MDKAKIELNLISDDSMLLCCQNIYVGIKYKYHFPQFIYFALLLYCFSLLPFICNLPLWLNLMKRLHFPPISLYNTYCPILHNAFFLVLQNILFIDWTPSNRRKTENLEGREGKKVTGPTKVGHVWLMCQMESKNQRNILIRGQRINCTNCRNRLEPLWTS